MSVMWWILIGSAVVTIAFVTVAVSYFICIVNAEENIVKALKNDPSTERVRDSVDAATGSVYVLIERHVANMSKGQQNVIRSYLKDPEFFMKLISFIERAAKKREVSTDTKEWGV